jgi:WD40 repeat protein
LIDFIVASDGRTVVGGFTNGEVRVADLFNGTMRVFPERHSEPIRALAISADRKTLATMGTGTELFWWDFATGRVVGRSRLPEPAGVWPKFSPDGKMLGIRGAHLLVWDVQNRTLRPISFKGPRNFAFSPDNQTLVTSDPLQLWNLNDGSRLGLPLEGHTQMVCDVTFSHDGLTVASAGDDGTLRLWSVATQQELLTFREPETIFNYPYFSDDGSTLVAGSMPDSGGIRIWRAPSFAEIDALEKANLHNH